MTMQEVVAYFKGTGSVSGVTQMAELYGISTMAVYKWVWAGQFPTRGRALEAVDYSKGKLKIKDLPYKK